MPQPVFHRHPDGEQVHVGGDGECRIGCRQPALHGGALEKARVAALKERWDRQAEVAGASQPIDCRGRQLAALVGGCSLPAELGEEAFG